MGDTSETKIVGIYRGKCWGREMFVQESEKLNTELPKRLMYIHQMVDRAFLLGLSFRTTADLGILFHPTSSNDRAHLPSSSYLPFTMLHPLKLPPLSLDHFRALQNHRANTFETNSH